MGRGMLISALISGSSGLSFAESDSLESMMAEGIPYENEAASHKTMHHAKHASHADMEAMMSEGIPYEHSKEMVIHAKSTHLQSMEAAMSEGIAYDEPMDVMRQKALQTMPAAGK